MQVIFFHSFTIFNSVGRDAELTFNLKLIQMKDCMIIPVLFRVHYTFQLSFDVNKSKTTGNPYNSTLKSFVLNRVEEGGKIVTGC